MSEARVEPHDLRSVAAFSDLSDDDVRWLADTAQLLTLDVGEKLIEQGDPVEHLFAILEGQIHLVRESGPPDDRWIVRSAGDVTGMLPHSRMTHSPVAGRALAPTRIAAWTTQQVGPMLDRIPILHARFAQALLDRSREFARLDEQAARLQSLGKLSAGLAHELNNPAAAIQRRVDELAFQLETLSRLAIEGLGQAAPSEAVEEIRSLARPADASDARAVSAAERDALERSGAQEALRTWLEGNGVDEAWRIAETLEAEGLSADTLERATEPFAPELRRAAARWLAADLAGRRLLGDVGDASGRIVDLIGAVKSYSNQDGAPAKGPVDVNEGLRSTIAMLKHQAQEKRLVVASELAAEIPPVHANAGELNQVWTNLVDNAIDASPVGGTVRVTSAPTTGGVRVRVIDAGTGIPAEIRSRIFEPFFTTKEVGEGTGIGLDIVRRLVHAHDGEIRVESEPGRTCFEVTLAGVEAEP